MDGRTADQSTFLLNTVSILLSGSYSKRARKAPVSYKEAESDAEGVDDSDFDPETIYISSSDEGSDQERDAPGKRSTGQGRGGGDDDGSDGDDNDGDDAANDPAAAAAAADEKNGDGDEDEYDEDEDEDEYDEEEEWILEEIQAAEQAKPQGWTGEEGKGVDDEAL